MLLVIAFISGSFMRRGFHLYVNFYFSIRCMLVHIFNLYVQVFMHIVCKVVISLLKQSILGTGQWFPYASLIQNVTFIYKNYYKWRKVLTNNCLRACLINIISYSNIHKIRESS